MYVHKILAALAVSLLLLLPACSQGNRASHDMGTKHTYTLCSKADDAREKLYEYAREFADREGGEFIDRGAGAQRELSLMKSSVLKKTSGEVILLTVEKPNEFRISITNLGLHEKIALTVRSWRNEGRAVDNFMHDLAKFWRIDRVEGSVTNDSPC